MHTHSHNNVIHYEAHTHTSPVFTCTHTCIHAHMHTPTHVHLPQPSGSSGLSFTLSPEHSLAFKSATSHFSPQIPVSWGFQASCKCHNILPVTATMIIIYTHSSLLSLSARTLALATRAQSKAPRLSLQRSCPRMEDITGLPFFVATPHKHFRQEAGKSVQSKLQKGIR